MTKRTNKPRKPRDEESSDEVSGLTCQHVNKAVDLSSVKKSVLSSVWLVCSECLKERTMIDGEPAESHDILVCLKCGFQGCNQSGIQHAVKHHQTFHPESHCITISLSTWKAWCFECNEELSTHCNKKALAQTLDFLQKHSVKAASAPCPVPGAQLPVAIGQPPRPSQAGPPSDSQPRLQRCRVDAVAVPHPHPHPAHRMTTRIRGIRRLSDASRLGSLKNKSSCMGFSLCSLVLCLSITICFCPLLPPSSRSSSPKIIKLREEPSDYTDPPRGKSPAINSTLVPVKGINNLGNTCFFNAVMQNLSQTHMLIDLIQELKEKGYKLRICP
eukprot:superscaffoldBa00001463_g10671